MSTPTCRDNTDFAIPAVIEWEEVDEADRTVRYLSHPDPRANSVLLESCFLKSQSTPGFFKLRIPVKIKGIDCDPWIFVLIHLDTIISFKYESFSEPVGAVQNKLDGSVICLRLHLSRNVDVISPTSAVEPLQPKRRPSGQVLDALRSIAVARQLVIHVLHKDISQEKLQAVERSIERAVSSACEERSRSRDDTLASFCSGLYGGKGAKAVNLANGLRQPDGPPSYGELEPPPPMAPLLNHGIKNNKKRRRPSSPDELQADPTAAVSSIWAHLIAEMRKHQNTFEADIKAHYESRFHHLEQRVETLEHDNKLLRRRLDQLDDSHAELNTQQEGTANAVDVVEADLREVRQDLDGLQDQVDEVVQDGLSLEVETEERLVESAAERVLDQLPTLNATVMLSRS